jgi:hypothetical protein
MVVSSSIHSMSVKKGRTAMQYARSPAKEHKDQFSLSDGNGNLRSVVTRRVCPGFPSFRSRVDFRSDGVFVAVAVLHGLRPVIHRVQNFLKMGML